MLGRESAPHLSHHKHLSYNNNNNSLSLFLTINQSLSLVRRETIHLLLRQRNDNNASRRRRWQQRRPKRTRRGNSVRVRDFKPTSTLGTRFRSQFPRRKLFGFYSFSFVFFSRYSPVLYLLGYEIACLMILFLNFRERDIFQRE